MQRTALVAATILSAAPVTASMSGVHTRICVTNSGGARLLFTAETDAGERVVAWLDPGGRLCAEGEGAGRVGVFEDDDSLEGCTRLVAAGGDETLLRYAAFDRCLWQSHLD